MDLEPIVLDHHKFRVVVRQVDIQPHGPFVHPLLGKAACWASTRRNHSPHMGVLTAKHAVTESVKRDQGLDSYSPQLGDFVPLADGSQGTLEDLAPDPIDIALVRTFEKAGSSILPTMKLIAPWSDVWLGPKRSKVITVADVRGVFTNPSMPAYVVLADSLQHGDSGTLVQDVSSGAAVGIYLGELTTPAGTVEGYARHAYQVEVIMNAELYL